MSLLTMSDEEVLCLDIFWWNTTDRKALSTRHRNTSVLLQFSNSFNTATLNAALRGLLLTRWKAAYFVLIDNNIGAM